MAAVPTVAHKLSPDLLKAIGHRLGEAMSDAHFTQKDLEYASHVTQGNISLLLNGERETGGTLLNAIRVAQALNVRIGWLIDGEEPKRLPGVLPPPKPKIVDADKETRANVRVRAKNSKK